MFVCIFDPFQHTGICESLASGGRVRLGMISEVGD